MDKQLQMARSVLDERSQQSAKCLSKLGIGESDLAQCQVEVNRKADSLTQTLAELATAKNHLQLKEANFTTVRDEKVLIKFTPRWYFS